MSTPTDRTTHTATPWEVHEVRDDGEVISRGFCQVGGKGINRGECYELFSEEDAEFIVRACNCHDELLAALKAMVASYDGLRDMLSSTVVLEKLKAADAAIQQATGAEKA